MRNQPLDLHPEPRSLATEPPVATAADRWLAAALDFMVEPIIGLGDGRQLACEVLARPRTGESFSRWLHDSPRISHDVWALAVTAARPHLRQGLVTHVNIAASHLGEFGMVRGLEHLLSADELRLLVIEVTEQEPVVSTMQLERNLADLREAGVTIALDDFGEGYANFTALAVLEPEVVKVRLPTIREVGGVDLSTWFLATCAAVGVRRTVLECVESAQDRDWARAAGFDTGQGFLWR